MNKATAKFETNLIKGGFGYYIRQDKRLCVWLPEGPGWNQFSDCISFNLRDDFTVDDVFNRLCNSCFGKYLTGYLSDRCTHCHNLRGITKDEHSTL